MEIFVFGDKKQFGEIKKKVSPRHNVSQAGTIGDLPEELEIVVFDFNMEENPESLEDYGAFENLHLSFLSRATALARPLAGVQQWWF